MSRYVTDTHPLHWHLANDTRLSDPARRIFREADAGLHQVYIAGITLIEMVYLVEKGKVRLEMVEKVLRSLDSAWGSYALAPLNQDTARAMFLVARSSVPDLPDRIIVATALQLGLPLITADGQIRKAGVVPVIW